MKKVSLLFFLFLLFLVFPLRVGADDILDKINSFSQQIQSLRQTRNLTQDEYNAAVSRLNDIKKQINQIESAISQKEQEVIKGEDVLQYQKNLLDKRTFSYYKSIKKNTLSLTSVIVSKNLSSSLRDFFYQKSLVDDDKNAIIKIVVYIKNLEQIKKELSEEKSSLATLKDQVDAQSRTLSGRISSLDSQISQLVSQQQSLIAQRLAALNLPQSAYTSTGGCSSDLTNGKDPGFSGGFGFFTFGVPHRVGMSQYGAKGRADSGQSAETILKFYYNADYTTGYDSGINIHVSGTNEYGQSFDDTWNIEEYLKHVYEIPTGWNSEALKAQAVAARSYALAYTGNGQKSICPSQSCQVVKREENSDAWKQAVDATRGIVMTSGGSPISAYFSSTAGGYVYSSSSSIGSRPWTKDSQDSNGFYGSFNDVRSYAYDKESPWFYCDWGSRPQYGNTAWLKVEEVADIVNVILLVQKDQSVIGNVYQTDTQNPVGKETWSSDRVKEELRSRGGTPFNSISSVGISANFSSGTTTNVTINGDSGTQTFSGTDFKTYFNQRAPGNLQIVGPLFSVERR